jgi:hypothetical protein
MYFNKMEEGKTAKTGHMESISFSNQEQDNV